MKSLFAGFVLMAAMTGAAQAEEPKMYLKLFGGANWSPDLSLNGVKRQTDTGYNLGAALGWNLTPNFALEGELFYDRSGYKTVAPAADISSLGLMVNGIYTFETGSAFKPYVGAGIGYSKLGYHTAAFDRKDWAFTWQAMAGARVAINEKVELFGEYRFRDANEAKDGLTKWDYKANVVSAGVRVNF